MKKIAKISILVICIAIIMGVASCSKKEIAEEKATPVVANEKIGNKVYFAAPLFNIHEQEFNLKLTNLLESYGYEVFLPQRDGYLAAEMQGKSQKELTDMIFRKDRDEVLKADIVFVLLDGRVPDEGACVELGIAYASGYRCYGF